ncbi:MAG TPA: hypothetical protein VGN34_34200 [Ktedonobacteraceae bacterium]
MSGRVPNRPHYRTMRQLGQPYKGNNQQFFRTGWLYRQQHPAYLKHSLGYGLSLLPLPRFPFVRMFQ